jgi:hypothetical protein
MPRKKIEKEAPKLVIPPSKDIETEDEEKEEDDDPSPKKVASDDDEAVVGADEVVDPLDAEGEEEVDDPLVDFMTEEEESW